MKNLPAFRPVKTILMALGFFFSFVQAQAQKDTLQNKLSLSYDLTHFDQQFSDDWQLASLEYSRRTGFGTLVGRLNHANRFARTGWQFETEAYPVLGKKLYAYVGLSVAGDVPVFPRWRTGSTLYYNFAKGWEAEGGFRYLYFDQSIWMGTVGLSKYAGAWLLNARSFFYVDAPLRNQSFFVKAQRYLRNEKDFLWLQVGSGVSPDESRNVQLNVTSQLASKRVAAGATFSVHPQLQLTLTAGYARDEYRSKTFDNQYSGSAGVGFRF
jgi:YaiO family outer membrane protein